MEELRETSAPSSFPVHPTFRVFESDEDAFQGGTPEMDVEQIDIGDAIRESHLILIRHRSGLSFVCSVRTIRGYSVLNQSSKQ